MDPTKSLDHLDPKLKETYARVMGTTTNGSGDATQNTSPAPVADPASLNTPAAGDPGQAQFGATAPFASAQNESPNPGTGPMVSNIPSDTTTMFSPPADAAPAADTSAPANSPFFSNPSPAISDPTQPPADSTLSAPVADSSSEPSPTPVTPYSPENLTSGGVGPADQYSQPLPSPSSVAQSAPHQASALLKVLYIVGAVIFFAIYTIFWIKVFNLPFLF